MSTKGEAGFTLVEVIVSIVVLSIGVMALAGSSGMVSRMLGEGKTVTTAANIAEQRLEILRRIADATTPRCGSGQLATGTATTLGMNESWTVATAGKLRSVTEIVTYRTARGGRADTMRTVLACY